MIMTQKTKQSLHLLYSIALSVTLTVAGLLLIIACIGIYNSGDRPFTPEAVAAAFSGIAIPVYLCLALIVGGFVFDGFSPLPTKKQLPPKQYEAILARLYDRCQLSGCSAQLQDAISRQQKSRRLHRLITLGLLALGSVIFLAYGTNPHNFHQSQITESMEKAVYILLSCMAAPFAYGVFTAYHRRKSMEAEIQLVKQAIRQAPGQAAQAPQKPVRQTPWLRFVILGIGLTILLIGFFTGGTRDVLTKAINICTECVGLG